MENITIPKKKKFSRKAKSNLFVLSFLIVPIVLFLIFYVAINLNSILLAFSNVALDGTRTFAAGTSDISFSFEYMLRNEEIQITKIERFNFKEESEWG